MSFPIAWTGDAIEDLEILKCDIEGAACHGLFIDQEQQILAKLIFGSLEGCMSQLLSEFTQLAAIGLNSTSTLTAELEIFGETADNGAGMLGIDRHGLSP